MKKSELRQMIKEEIQMLSEDTTHDFVFKLKNQKINTKLDNTKRPFIVFYYYEKGDNLTKDDLVIMRKQVGENFQLYTNAGIDLHSSEGNSYKGVTIHKTSFQKMKKYISQYD